MPRDKRSRAVDGKKVIYRIVLTRAGAVYPALVLSAIKSLDSFCRLRQNHAQMNEPEAKIMIEVAGGNLAAFRTIVEFHHKPLISFIARFTGDRDSAEDIAQEVFLRVFKAAKGYKPQAKFKTWLFTIATNLCLNEIRDIKSSPKFVDLSDWHEHEYPIISPDAFSPQKAAENAELNTAVRKAISNLPENQRIAILLRQYNEFSYGEISKIMGVSTSAVESLIQRARQSLKKSLSPFL
jgi:RNA polymerase sigma-70 factor (ECF subfamily)